AAKARGPLDALHIEAELQGDALALGARRLDRLRLNISGANGPRQAGRIDGEFRAAGLAGTFATPMTLDGRRLDIGGLRGAAAGSSITGALTTDLDSRLTGGSLGGRIADLAPFSPLAGMKLSGNGDFKAVLDTRGGQGVELALNARGLKAGQDTAVAQV